MADPLVYIVHLRRPNMKDTVERRTDPLFEFGSFGCTGCHSRNLMNPKRIEKLRGARLAFAQGGPHGFRLVYLTPPLDPRAFDDRTEARWSPAEMPFRYAHAPVLACNGRPSDFPEMEKIAASTRRSTVEGGFSSSFRSRVSPLGERVAVELVQVYEQLRATGVPLAIARTYDEALPYPPPLIDRQRHATYKSLMRELGLPTPPARRCPQGSKERAVAANRC
jgi:hypothetical protein